MKNNYKKLFFLCTIILLCLETNGILSVSHVKRQFRGLWIAGVENIDWPSKKGLTIDQQKNEFINYIREAKADNLNALIVHVRPTADSYYPSKIFPWSEWITGHQGHDPGYDPLKFAVEETHKANMEFHAWFNPYRVSTQTDINKLVDDHPARKHPEWVIKYNTWLFFNPGLPETRELVTAGIEEVVNNYDVDAVHFDDYFYPYPGKSEFNDSAAYKKYGEKYFPNKSDWRRNNTNLLIKGVYERIKKLKPHVKFGISPFGIWRNKDTDPTGSESHGLQCYDALYADTRTWIKHHWIDYVVPQLYWTIGYKPAPYDHLVEWWNHEVKDTNVQLYIGHAATRVGSNSTSWDDPHVIERQMELNLKFPFVGGSVLWDVKHVMLNKLGFRDILKRGLLSHPSLIPESDNIHHEEFNQKVMIKSALNDNATMVSLMWQLMPNVHSDKVWYFVVYRFVNEHSPHPNISTADNIVALVKYNNTNVQQYDDHTVLKGTNYSYYVSAVTRFHREGPLSALSYVHINK